MNRFEEIRLLKNYTKSQIAGILGVSVKAYNNWESNKYTIPTRRLIQLADLYKINIDYLINLSNIKLSKKSFNDFNMKEIGIRVREVRLELNLTIRELAEILSIDNSTWSKYENAVNLIQTTFLIETCKKSGISADYVLNRSEVKYLEDL